MKTILKLTVAAAIIWAGIAVIFNCTQQQPVFETGMAGEKRQVLISLGQSRESISISWKGDKYGSGCLRFASSMKDLPGAKTVLADKNHILGTSYYRYSVKIHCPGRVYYEIGDGISFDSPQLLKVPEAKFKTSFMFLGDIQLERKSSEWQAMVRKGCADNCSFALLGGDMINVPTDLGQWEVFLENCQAFNGLPIMAAPGNHEGVHSNITYRKIFRLPENGPEGLEEAFYYFDYGLCRIIVLDSSFFADARIENTGRLKWNAQKEAVENWLAETLKGSRRVWNIAVIHHPPYGMHDDKDISQRLRESWVPVLEKEKADLVLSGHQHLYMRTRPINGVVYMMGNSGVRSSSYFDGSNKPFYVAHVSSQAGYQRIEGSLQELRIISYNKKGRILDEAVIKKSFLLHVLEFLGGD